MDVTLVLDAMIRTEGEDRLKDEVRGIQLNIRRPTIFKPPDPRFPHATVTQEEGNPIALVQQLIEETNEGDTLHLLVEQTDDVVDVASFKGLVQRAAAAGRDLELLLTQVELPDNDG